MAQLAVLMAGLLLVAESQASDVAGRSTPQGFMSKYMSSPIVRPASQVQDSMAFKDFDTPKIADREEEQAAQKLLANHSTDPISLSIFGIGLVSFVTMLGLTLWRALQPATIPTNSGGLGLDMPMMEMKSQDSHVNVNSGRVGWGQLSSQNLHPRTVMSAELKAGPARPTLYVYDHCPFCVRARLAFGLKGIKHDVRFMANDDVDLPTALIGKKIAPIFDDGKSAPYAESLDIVRNVDKDSAYGPTGTFRELSDRTDLKAWQKSVQATYRCLSRPRYVKSYLPEFVTESSRSTFVKNHQMPPAEKADWKSDKYTMEQRWALYNDQSKDAELIAEMNSKLKDLEPLIHSPDCCTEGGLSLDDIDLWSRLRSLTIVKGLEFPPKVRAYLDTLATKGDLPLYDAIAL